MSWRDELRPASFRGVPFETRATDADSGRRAAVLEPIGQVARPQDLGPLPSRFRVEAFVIGDDYVDKLRALREACERPGPGELVLPYRGPMRVQAMSFASRQRTEDQGMATVFLEFVEAPEVRDSSTSSTAQADGEAAALSDTAEQAFGAESGLEDASTAAAEAAAGESTLRAAWLAGQALLGAPAAVLSLARKLDRLIRPGLDLIGTPYVFAHEWRTAIGAVELAAGSRKLELDLYLGLLDLEQAESANGDRTPAEQAAIDSTAGLVGQLAAASAVRAAARLEWESRQEAEALRARLAAALDRLDETAPDAVFWRLSALRAALAGAVPPPGAQLPDLVDLEVDQPMPALVLAYALYSTADREPELVSRNAAAIRHPGQIRAKTRLEVLSA